MRRTNKFQPAKTKVRLPEPFTVDIEKFSHDGRGLGRHHGRVVLVSNALPGETVRVKVEQANSKLWQANAIEVIGESSDQRRLPQCEHFGRCGGCQLQHISHAVQVQLKQHAIEDHLRRNQVALPEWSAPIQSPEHQYRARARFHVNKRGEIGFHGERGNDHIAIEHCPVLTPELSEAFALLRRNAPLQGLFQLEVAVGDRGEIGIKPIKGLPKAVSEIKAWSAEMGWSCDQPLAYAAGDNTVTAAPGDFTQVNRIVNAQMIAQAIDWLAPDANSRVLDLFCGNGNFSLPLAERAAAVHGIEGSDTAISRARAAAMSFDRCSFSVENLFSADLHLLPEVSALKPDLLLLDPPRAGAEHICQQLHKVSGLQRILYVSCDPSTLARDLNYLQSDKWHLRKVGLIDMFPQTRHIETMALLEK